MANAVFTIVAVYFAHHYPVLALIIFSSVRTLLVLLLLQLLPVSLLSCLVLPLALFSSLLLCATTVTTLAAFTAIHC